jgi:hypothetical protein
MTGMHPLDWETKLVSWKDQPLVLHVSRNNFRVIPKAVLRPGHLADQRRDENQRFACTAFYSPRSQGVESHIRHSTYRRRDWGQILLVLWQHALLRLTW